MALTRQADGETADAADINQIVDLLNGLAGSGQPVAFTQVSDASNYALDVRNLDSTNSRALRVRADDGTVLIQADATGVTASPDGASAATVVTTTHTQTLQNKTYATPAITGDVTQTSTDAGATGPTYTFDHSSASPAASDVTGRLDFKGNDDAGNDATYGRIETTIQDPANGSEDGRVTISAMKAGTLTEIARIDASGLDVRSGSLLVGGAAVTALEATINAKGDLLVGTADNTAARLAVGTNGQVLTADSAQSTGVKWASVDPAGAVKTADTSRDTTTSLTDDPHLTVSVAASTDYLFECLLFCRGHTGGDLKVDFTTPASPTLIQWAAIGPPEAESSGGASDTIAADVDLGYVAAAGTGKVYGMFGAGAGNYIGLLIRGILRNGANAGSLTLQWAQGTSNGTATTLLAGSYLKARVL